MVPRHVSFRAGKYLLPEKKTKTKPKKGPKKSQNCPQAKLWDASGSRVPTRDSPTTRDGIPSCRRAAVWKGLGSSHLRGTSDAFRGARVTQDGFTGPEATDPALRALGIAGGPQNDTRGQASRAPGPRKTASRQASGLTDPNYLLLLSSLYLSSQKSMAWKRFSALAMDAGGSGT